MVLTAASSVDGMKVQDVPNEEGSSSVKSTVNSVDSSASAQGFNATPTLLLNHKGQKPHVASVGLPTLSSLEAQIESAIAG
jgi:hypothetical protein